MFSMNDDFELLLQIHSFLVFSFAFNLNCYKLILPCLVNCSLSFDFLLKLRVFDSSIFRLYWNIFNLQNVDLIFGLLNLWFELNVICALWFNLLPHLVFSAFFWKHQLPIFKFQFDHLLSKNIVVAHFRSKRVNFLL